MIRLLFIAFLTVCGMCCVSSSFGQKIELELTVSAEVQGDERVIFVGTTNLPDGTDLMLSLEDGVTGERKGQTTLTVVSGAYRSKPIGTQRFRDGRYIARVTMPYSLTQSDEIRKTLGQKGENLIGDLIERDDLLGATANVETEFYVGNKDSAIELQLEQHHADMKTYKAIVGKTNKLYRELNKNSGFLKDEKKPEKWRVFAMIFTTEVEDLREQIENFDSHSAKVNFVLPLGDLLNLFHGVAANSSDEIQKKEKKHYLESVRIRNKFLRQLSAQLKKNSNEKPKSRIWTSKTGKHKTEAEFVKVENDVVTLRKKDGELVKLPIDRLSETDQQFVIEIKK